MIGFGKIIMILRVSDSLFHITMETAGYSLCVPIEKTSISSFVCYDAYSLFQCAACKHFFRNEFNCTSVAGQDLLSLK